MGRSLSEQETIGERQRSTRKNAHRKSFSCNFRLFEYKTSRFMSGHCEGLVHSDDLSFALLDEMGLKFFVAR
jgi:hypothetical protein